MGKVIYLTGPPASGKSTLCEKLREVVTKLEVLSYSALLRDLLNRETGHFIDEIGVRRESARIITKQHVDTADNELISLVQSRRTKTNIIIDSHPVTKEDFGFRITAFSTSQLELLRPDKIICLYVPAETVAQRIVANSEGRPLPSKFEIEFHSTLQANVAAQYGVILGQAVHLIDSSVELPKLVDTMIKICKFD